MANIIRNFIDSLHLADDDDMDEEYDEYLAETSERERRRAQRSERRSEKGSRRYAPEDDEEEQEPDYRSNTSNFSDLRRERASAKPERERERQQQSRVVPFRGNTGVSAMGIKVMKPTSFEDSQDICDVLLAGKATIINLEGFNVDLAQRVMDFVSGAVYAANGKLHQISNYIFIISPENVDISGDYFDMLKQNGFEVPTLFGRE